MMHCSIDRATSATGGGSGKQLVFGTRSHLRTPRVRRVALGNIDLRELVVRLADRRKGRTEANVQSDIHTLLLAAPLNLDDHQVADSVLEQQAGDRRRIDIEVGFTVIEVKRDLRVGKVLADAEEQLAGYVAQRTELMNQRYVGVLSDGCEWRLYHHDGSKLHGVSRIELDPKNPDVDAMVVWLEGVLSTTTAITPTPTEIARRLGTRSPSHELDYADLLMLYRANANNPSVQLKRELWAKLLTTALGTQFSDEDDLFVNHTLLVVMAEVIAHCVVGFDPSDPTISAHTITSGALFTATAQIGGVVEADFFDWITEVEGGARWVKALARRLSRFAWHQVQHDVMKVLYESVISTETRKKLGEYYTPDWLANRVVNQIVTKPLAEKVLDPACGSGTFLFAAIRHYIAAAVEAGHTNSEIVSGVVSHVSGIDVHPVAVAFARTTYLLAIGIDRIAAEDRPAFSVPVYLGDSVQWGQSNELLASGSLVVPTADGKELFTTELRFPERLLDDAGRFDRLVAELANKATERKRFAAPPSLGATFKLFGVHPDDRDVINDTFAHMCRLHDEDRNHIWGYYVRNLARPVWLARKPNRVDCLVGNPPWLAFRYMTAEMQTAFRSMARERGLWAGSGVATNQDLAGLFLARTVELYLKHNGRFGYVMPLAVLSRGQHEGLRSGRFPVSLEPISVQYDTPWDLHQVKPAFFPVPAAVLGGQRVLYEEAGSLPQPADMWSGRLPGSNPSWDDAEPKISRTSGINRPVSSAANAYAERFSQGATVVPRMLFTVEFETASSPLGVGAGRRAVRSRRSPAEKQPWKSLPTLTGAVERQFIRNMYLGDTVLPYRTLDPLTIVVPYDGQRLIGQAQDQEQLDNHPGVAAWWKAAVATWNSHRSSDRLSLQNRLNYQKGFANQFPASPHRVVYTKAGMYLAAAVVSDTAAVIDHKLYWGSTATLDEARYLCAIFNSDALTLAVRPHQGRGEHNPRDFDKYVFQVPFPLYDKNDQHHTKLVELAKQAEVVAAGVELRNVKFEAQRRDVRNALAKSGVTAAIDVIVTALIGAD